jgi:8-oxo-dGTP pyrophosphatase MutT (NUDIX family)
MPISPYLKKLRAKIGHEMVLMPGVSAVVFNDQDEVLLVYSADFGRWELIGGGVDPDEQWADAAVREVLEETGLDVIPERLVMIESLPKVVYPNKDEVQYMGVVFACRVVGGTLKAQESEVLDLGFFPINALPPLSDRDQRWLDLALENQTRTYFIHQNELKK